MRFLPLVLLSVLPAFAQQHSLYQSLDRGLTWTRAAASFPGNPRINALAASSSTLFAGAANGLYLSPLHGLAWRKATVPGNPRVNALAVTRSTVFAATSSAGLFVSSDEGANWAPLAGFPSRNVRSLLAAPSGLYAGTDAQGVYHSIDAGQSWLPLAAGLPARSQVFALAMHRGTLYAALYAKGLFAWDAVRGQWARVGAVQPLALAASASALAVGHNPGGIFWAGEPLSVAWRRASAPFPANAPVWEMAGGEDLLLAGAAAGVYRSLDGGRTWTAATQGLPPNSPGIAFLIHRDAAFAALLTP